jgi:RNA polymerase sigma factor (sigma-70 family)
MLKLWKSSQRPALSHETVFMARYEALLRWALRLTNNQRDEAEDLLHDSFIEFSLGQADLSAIENIDGYLRTVLRNIHLSALRKSSRHPSQPLLLVDYDSLVIGLRQTEPQSRLQLQDQLRAICQYACLRKETSKAGSALILRFFLDYYPGEVARVMRTSSRAVSEWLRLARAEARIYLEDPGRLNFLGKQTLPILPLDIHHGRATEDLSRELRRILFELGHVDGCFDTKYLAQLFHSKNESTIDCATLSQIVTCPRCLDVVNDLQGLPLLADRYSEQGGSDTRPPSDNTGSQVGDSPLGSTKAGRRDHLEESQRRVKEVFEHRPEELYISANGLFLVSQKINAGRAEQTLSVNIDEEIGFIEIQSEQSLRLLLLNVEPPPSGDGEQAKTVSLSDGRELTATLRFSGAQPTLRVLYDDPAYHVIPSLKSDAVALEVEELEKLSSVESAESSDFSFSFFARVQKWTRENVFRPRFWLRPGVVTCLSALLILGVFFLFRQPVARLSASDLLLRSANVDAKFIAQAGEVFHRTLKLEIAEVSDQPGSRVVINRQRIEIWQAGEKKITARRLYDERGALIAGVWTRPNGVQTLYHHGVEPQLKPSSAQVSLPDRINDDPWLRSPTAAEFLAATGNSNSFSLEERSDVYVVNYQRQNLADTDGLLRASITLRKTDLHPLEMTFIVAANDPGPPANERGGHTNRQSTSGNRQWLEYYFIETGFEEHPANTISPTVFEPEPELLSTGSSGIRNTKNEKARDASAGVAVAPVASAELEVEVLGALDRVRAFQGEQLGVTRTSEGGLLVQAILDSDQRKAEILNALRPLAGNPAVHIQVETVAEASERVARSRRPAAKLSDSSISNETVEVEKTALPVDAELCNYFRSRGVPAERVDEEIRRYATRVIDRSLQALLHARALKQLASQFSEEALRSLDADARAKWRAMLVEHARAFARETSGLRRELEPVFFLNEGGSESSVDLRVESDRDLQFAAARLFEQASAHERAISLAFSNSTNGEARSTAVKSDQFRRSLRQAELLADRIARHP